MALGTRVVTKCAWAVIIKCSCFLIAHLFAHLFLPLPRIRGIVALDFPVPGFLGAYPRPWPDTRNCSGSGYVWGVPGFPRSGFIDLYFLRIDVAVELRCLS